MSEIPPQTITQKIIAAHAGREYVQPGEIVNAKVDLALANDITGPAVIEIFEGLGSDQKVFDPNKVVLVPDHFTPNKDIKSAQLAKRLRDFANAQGTRYYEVGRGGIEHVILPEKGLIKPGDIIIGADSHTCTYGALGAFSTGVGSTDLAAVFALGEVWLKVPPTIKFVYNGRPPKWIGGKDLILATIGRIGVDGALYSAMEFTGDAFGYLKMADRFTMSNMAIEAGGKNGIFHVDQATLRYLEDAGADPGVIYESDPDATYAAMYEFDVSKMEPQVAFPHLPSNVHPVSEGADIEVDQAVIGSCTNGRLEDLRIAAAIIKGRKVHPRVRGIIIPGSQYVYTEAIKEGLVQEFVAAGFAVSTPTCGPCLGGYMGILAEGERAVSPTHRNFVGRLGHPERDVYRAGPAVAAASAIAGHLASPEEVVGRE
jgi:3-isopropylmalate/(R)-2-methylmalate dehydratase large subunit